MRLRMKEKRYKKGKLQKKYKSEKLRQDWPRKTNTATKPQLEKQ